MHPFDIVDEFERVVAEYTDSPYAVAVDSCTNALLLCLILHRMKNGSKWIAIPNRTYVGVAHSVINAGHKCRFIDLKWHGVYVLGNTNIIDSARRFRKCMYLPSMQMCLSFHWGKVLPIGRGGMILLDNRDDYELLRRMRYDGRTGRVAPTDDNFDVPGFHMLLHPDDAARGLMLMKYIPKYNDDLPWDDYPDLSKHKYFTEANR